MRRWTTTQCSWITVLMFLTRPNLPLKPKWIKWISLTIKASFSQICKTLLQLDHYPTLRNSSRHLPSTLSSFIFRTCRCKIISRGWKPAKILKSSNKHTLKNKEWPWMLRATAPAFNSNPIRTWTISTSNQVSSKMITKDNTTIMMKK